MQNSASNPYASFQQAPLMEEDSRPTSVRFAIVGLCITMAVLLYVHRFALTPVSVQVREDFELDEVAFGYVISAFFFSYAILQVPVGWLSDVLGARITLTAMVAIWSIAFIAIGFVEGFAGLILLRVLFGVMQAGAYPTAAACIKRWVPLQSRGKASAAVSMGGRCGGLIALGLTPLFVSWVQASRGGLEAGSWRPVFIGYGLLGLIWAIFFYFIFRNSPRQHHWCNTAEIELIEGTTDKTPAATNTPSNRSEPAMRYSAAGLLNLVLLAAINLFVNIAWIFLATWIAVFLTNKLPETTEISGNSFSAKTLAGYLSAIPAIGGLIGSLLGGYMTDYFFKHNGRIWGRRIPGIAACVLASSLYLLCSQTSNLVLLIPAFFAISLTIDLGLGSTWTTVQDIGGKNVGLVLGICNMCGNLGATLFGFLIGRFAKADDWRSVFLISVAALVLTLLCWLGVDPTKPILVPENAEPRT